MNQEGWLASVGLTWRDGVIALIGLLGVYIVLAFLRLNRIRHPAAPGGRAADLPPLKDQDKTDPDLLGDVYTRTGTLAPDPEAAPAPAPVTPPRDFAWNEPPAAFGEEKFIEGVERELDQLRDEVAMLRQEFSLLRDEVRNQVSQLKASQNVSPLYSDAMQMAMAGHDAETIAERCGIARAEAELVVALATNRSE